MRRYHRKASLFPAIYQKNGLGPIRSLRDFDDKIVARYCGFKDADDYYYRAACAYHGACSEPGLRYADEVMARAARYGLRAR